MEFRCLGPLEVRALDGMSIDLGGPQQRLVLALLLVNSNEVVSVDHIIDDIWGESPPDTARKTIQGYMSELRKILPAGSTLTSQPPGYMLEVKPRNIDAHQFESLAAEGASEVTNDPYGARDLLEEAFSMWRGRPFLDLGDADALRPEVTRLNQIYSAALEARIAADIYTGRESSVVSELGDLTLRHPLRERLWVLHALALYRVGRQTEALRTCREARRTLGEDVGLEPGPELRLLEQRIYEQDPILGTMAALEPSAVEQGIGARNPYKGLRAFEEDDAGDFYGRDALVRRLREALGRRREARVIVLAGPSGSGKSSVARAGLIPELRREGANTVVLYPGNAPLDALASATDNLDGTHKTVLIVDQLEELFTLAALEDRAPFLDALVELGTTPNGPWILATIRADFLDRLLVQPRFAPLIEPGLLLVTPLEDHEVRDIIIQPASRVGIDVDPDLVAAAVSQVSNRPSTLPLLEYALTDLYDRSGGRTLTLAGLEAAGGISGALVRRAEEIYAGLDPTGQSTSKQLFLSLVTVAEEGEPLRHRLPKAAIGGLPKTDEVLSDYGNYRLLTFDRDASGEPTVEVAHEALLREWPRLADWIDQAHDDIRRHRQLAEAAADWDEHGRDDAFLLSGSGLSRFADWPDTDLAPTGDVEAFLTASREAETERRRLQRNRRRRVLAGFGAAAVIATVLAVVALAARTDAQSKAQRAFANELSAAAVPTIEGDPELAILLSLQALGTNPDLAESMDYRATLRRAMDADLLIERHTVAAPGDLFSMGLAPDGSALAYWTPGELHVVDPGTWEPKWTHTDGGLLPDPSSPINTGAPVFSPDGRYVAIGTSGESARLLVFESSTGTLLEQIPFTDAQCGVHAGPQSWSADGRYVGVAVNTDCNGPFGAALIQILDSESWDVAADIPVFGQVVFAEDAPRFAAIPYPINRPGLKALLYDTENFEIVAEVGATSGDLDPDGRAFAAADPDTSATTGFDLYDLDTRRLTDRLAGLPNRPATFATDFIPFPGGFGQIVVAGGEGKKTGLWHIDTGDLIGQLPTGEVNTLGYSEATQRLYTASTGGTISVWDLSTGGRASPGNAQTPYWFEANRFSVNPESSIGVAMHWGDPSTPIESFAAFDISTGLLRETLIVEIAHRGVVALPAGRVLFLEGDSVSGTAGPLSVWDAVTRELATFGGCVTGGNWQLDSTGESACIDGGEPFMFTGFPVVTADGTELISMGPDGDVQIWNAFTLERSERIDTGGAIGGPAAVEAAGGDWILLRRLDNGQFVVVGRPSAEVVATFEFDLIENVEVARDGTFLLMRSLDGRVARCDTDDWRPRTLFDSGQFVRGLALSPDGDRLMASSTDGFALIIDADNGEIVNQAEVENVSDGHWIDDDHIAYGTGTTGMWGVITLDFDEVVERAIGQLTRAFSDEECRIYRIDPCPTLEEMRTAVE